jgi:hypothetical protein
VELRVDIIIPLFYQDNTPIEDEVLVEVHDEIITVFDEGLTKDQSNVDGVWKHPQKKVYVKEVNRSVWAVCDDTPQNRQACRKLMAFIQTKTKQHTIFMTWTPTEIVTADETLQEHEFT